MTFASQEFKGRPSLHYLEGPASGPPILLLHGVGRFSEDFSTLASPLSSRWATRAIDLRGHGRSARAPGEYLVVDYARDIVDFVRASAQEPVILLGHSLGAMVALAVAAEVPRFVSAAILEDPPFHTMGREIDATSWKPLFIGMREVARRGGRVEDIQQALGLVEVPDPNGSGSIPLHRLRSRESLAFSARCLSMIDPEVFTPIVEGRWLDGYDERALLARVQCPVLLLQGDPACGAALKPADAAMAVSLIPTLQHRTFLGVGHLIHGDQPDAVLREVDTFLGNISLLHPQHSAPFPLTGSARARPGISDPTPSTQSNQSL